MKVKFIPQNVEFEIQPGQSVMNLAHEKGIPIHSTCNGMPSCAECRVRVVEGEHNLLSPSKKELSLIGTGYYIDQRRLSCQLVCFGDVTIDTKEHLDRLNTGHVTKKFLSRVQKDSADQSYSVGDVLIEKDEELMKSIGTSGGMDDSESSKDGELFNQMLQTSDKKGPNKGQNKGPQDQGRGRNRNRNRRRGR